MHHITRHTHDHAITTTTKTEPATLNHPSGCCCHLRDYFIDCIYLYILVTIIVGTEQQQLVMLMRYIRIGDLVELVTIDPISYSDVPGTSTPYLIWKKLAITIAGYGT